MNKSDLVIFLFMDTFKHSPSLYNLPVRMSCPSNHSSAVRRTTLQGLFIVAGCSQRLL